MKLVTFDTTNMVSQRKGDACISISRQGFNSISKNAVERTGFAEGDKIALHQDQENPEDWYMSLGEDGFSLKASKDGGGLSFNSAAMSNAFLDALQIEENRVAFFIAGEPTTIDEVDFWAILTSKPIVKKRKAK